MSGDFEDKQCKYAFKVVLTGDSGVGKSNIFSRFIKNEFNQEFKSTIGGAYASRKVNININEEIIKALIWDSAGHYRYDFSIDTDYRGSQGALLVYDITRKVTFENLEGWLKEIRCHTDQNFVIVLIGNKADLNHLRQVQTNDAKAFAERENISVFMETSALESLNVEDAFTKVCTQIYHNIRNKDKGTCHVTGTSSLNYLQNDIKGIAVGKKKLSKEHPSKDPETRGPMVEESNEACSRNIIGGTTVVPLHDIITEEGNNEVVEDIDKVLSRVIDEKSKLVRSYNILLDSYMKSFYASLELEKDRKMLITKVIPLVVRKLRRSPEYCSALAKLQGFAIRLGRQQNLEAFQEAYLKDHTEELENSDPTAAAKFEAATREFEEIEFSYIKEVSSYAHRTAKDILNIDPSQDLPRI